MTKIYLVNGGALDLANVAHELGCSRVASRVKVLDIAQALAKVNRFGGHTPRLYSVAEHSLHVVTVMERDLLVRDPVALMCGLMHDAHEAYVGDMTTPVQQALGGLGANTWEFFERAVQRAVLRRFDLEDAYPVHRHLVHEADMIVLASEVAGFGLRADEVPPLRHAPSVHLHMPDYEGLDWRDWSDSFCERYAELLHGIEEAGPAAVQPMNYGGSA
jgi:hypothetical protein